MTTNKRIINTHYFLNQIEIEIIKVFDLFEDLKEKIDSRYYEKVEKKKVNCNHKWGLVKIKENEMLKNHYQYYCECKECGYYIFQEIKINEWVFVFHMNYSQLNKQGG